MLLQKPVRGFIVSINSSIHRRSIQGEKEMEELEFEPFQDRLSRDIRNELSSAMVESLRDGNMDAIKAVADRYLQQELPAPYHDYIKDRLKRYDKALGIIWRSDEEDPFYKGLVLWDCGLQFEVHEVLEHAWYHAVGEEKFVLQAMIRAAGVYIKREYGYQEPAKKLAAKAVAVLEKTRLLDSYCDISILVAALQDESSALPILLGTRAA